jgi:hypothetical protein
MRCVSWSDDRLLPRGKGAGGNYQSTCASCSDDSLLPRGDGAGGGVSSGAGRGKGARDWISCVDVLRR